jgi:hypothetical protein
MEQKLCNGIQCLPLVSAVEYLVLPGTVVLKASECFARCIILQHQLNAHVWWLQSFLLSVALGIWCAICSTPEWSCAWRCRLCSSSEAHLLWYGLLTWMWTAGSTIQLLPGIVLSPLLALRGAGAVPFCLE